MSGRLNADVLQRFLAPLSFLPHPGAASSAAAAAVGGPVATSSSFVFLLCGSDQFHADVTRMLLHVQQVHTQDIFLF